ncbi:VOC family protein [Streptomyces sp. ACA25]|uniref:VOC family protein n=1 Tax=Streptomyces sp. ACA25 TaxID=3022596 RepID=UPI002307006D|nr:VOC family protein [Streptomyces sp. ACA25]MDB1087175.1 VOC family protein [Streptomyces sp. ACA25]
MAIATMNVTVLDCPDPKALAEFYAGVLGGTVDGEAGWYTLTTEGGAKLAFQEAPDHVPPQWPSPDAPQQLHLDFDVADLEASREPTLALGARLLDDSHELFHVYADPAGHPFCLCVG